MQKVYYAVKHLPTGKFLPCRGSARKGATHLELSDTEPPRLFEKHGHARLSMKNWASGPQYVRWESYGDGGDVEENWYTDPKPERKLDELQVVEMILTEKIDAK